MIYYYDGAEARVGDIVDYDGITAVVEEMFPSAEESPYDDPGLSIRLDLTLFVQTGDQQFSEQTFLNQTLFLTAFPEPSGQLIALNCLSLIQRASAP